MNAKKMIFVGIYSILLNCDNGAEKNIKTENIISKDSTKGSVSIERKFPCNASLVAEKEVQQLGINLSENVTIYDTNHVQWKITIQKYEKLYGPDILKGVTSLLSNRKYQAICFQSREKGLGGKIWYFIDETNCEVITMFTQK